MVTMAVLKTNPRAHLSSSASSNCPGTGSTLDILTHLKLKPGYGLDHMRVRIVLGSTGTTISSAQRVSENYFRGFARDYGEREGEESYLRYGHW